MASASLTRVAVLGTGIMGAPMARNLAAADCAVTVWNRTAAKAEALGDVATVAPSAAAAVAEAEFVLTMLEHGPATSAVLFGEEAPPHPTPPSAGAARHAPMGALFIDMASIEPDRARAHAATLAAMGAEAVDAPVSGGEAGAIAGTLAIMMGGSESACARAAAVLAPLGRAARVGGPGAGQAAKLANQTIVGVTIGAVAEALALAEAEGCDPAAVRAALQGGFADSKILEAHGRRMIEGDYAPGGPCRLQRKDLDNALRAAAAGGLDLPLTRQAARAYAELVEDQGGAELDHSAYRLWLERQASQSS
ncbi:MAG: NAD(P)-dependent oxidoreductase [Pseudomonadota bacterium]